MTASPRTQARIVGVLTVLVLLAFALPFLLVFEGSFGHDGLLCEWGITTDANSNGCGE